MPPICARSDRIALLLLPGRKIGVSPLELVGFFKEKIPVTLHLYVGISTLLRDPLLFPTIFWDLTHTFPRPTARRTSELY